MTKSCYTSVEKVSSYKVFCKPQVFFVLMRNPINKHRLHIAVANPLRAKKFCETPMAQSRLKVPCRPFTDKSLHQKKIFLVSFQSVDTKLYTRNNLRILLNPIRNPLIRKSNSFFVTVSFVCLDHHKQQISSYISYAIGY